MTLLVNIIDEEYERLKRSNFHTVVEECVRNGTPIPDNATNGDVIKAMFPDVEIRFFTTFSGIHTVDVDFEDNTLGRTYSVHTFNLDWWNAPYQKGGK